MRVALAACFPAVLAAACLFPGPTAAASADVGRACGDTAGLRCLEVDVPIDRSGRVLGKISLHAEVLPARGTPRGVVFLVAGGPGQASAGIFHLGSKLSALRFRSFFPGYTLVAYDDRGTGSSGFLRCPPTSSRVESAEGATRWAAGCAESIGPARDFYGTGDHAEDLEAVRQALGVDRIAIWGTSYGTKLAVAYALAHPDHVERLVLDSVLPPELPDPFDAETLQALPATLDAFCSGDPGCRATTPDFASEVVALANDLGSTPLVGTVLRANGTRQEARMDGLDFLSLVVEADLNPGLAAELPAVVHAARAGNPRPLLRTFELEEESSGGSSGSFSTAMQLATICRDGPFPWLGDTAIEVRPALVQSALDALGPIGLGPFGPWAATLGDATWCLDWPGAAGGVPLASGPLPDVPVLALSGGFDMRTPTSGAAAVVSRFPQGRLLVVPGVGHSVLTMDMSGCATHSLRNWLADKPIPDRCPREKPLVPALAAFPAPAAGHAPEAHRTLAIASRTLREAEATWLMAGEDGAELPGLYGGKLVASGDEAFRLERYSIVPGVTLSGKVKIFTFYPPLRFHGSVTVGGAAATPGTLKLAGGRLVGTLGGHRVRG